MEFIQYVFSSSPASILLPRHTISYHYHPSCHSIHLYLPSSLPSLPSLLLSPLLSPTSFFLLLLAFLILIPVFYHFASSYIRILLPPSLPPSPSTYLPPYFVQGGEIDIVSLVGRHALCECVFDASVYLMRVRGGRSRGWSGCGVWGVGRHMFLI